MIKHILADGTELKSIEGRTIPPTGKTEAVYRLIAEFLISSRPIRTAEGSRGQKTGHDPEGNRKPLWLAGH